MYASADVHTDTHRDKRDKGFSGVFYVGDMKPQPCLAFPGLGMIWVHGSGSMAAFDGCHLDHGSLPVKDVKVMGALYVS